MLFPATLWGFSRQVTLAHHKCFRSSCLTRIGTHFGHRYVCSRHALEYAAIERAAGDRVSAVAR